MAEQETKLTAPTGFQMPELAGPDDGFLADPQPARRYTTVYWDTPDLRLARWDATLRHRDGEGWTVKLPGDRAGALLVRDEYTFAGGPKRVPDEALALLRAYVRGARLAPVARSRAERRPTVLRDAAGNHLAEVVDDEVQVLEGRRVTDRYRELEVELGDAAQPDTLDKLLARLREAGATETPAQASKYRQALGGRELAPAELTVADLDRDASVEELLRGDLAASTLRLFRHLPAVWLDEDPEAVHQARVAVRRLRSTMRTARAVLDQDWTGRLRDELKWFADLLGTVRDADVLQTRLQARLAALPEADQAGGRRLLAHLAGQRDAARASLVEAIAAPRFAQLLDDAVAGAQAPAVTAEAAGLARNVLPPLVRKEWKKLTKAIGKAGDDPGDSALHRIRIRAKRTRYAAEAASPVIAKPARRLAKAAEAVQEVLGEQHDAVVAEGWLREAAAGARREALLPAGELVAAERAAAGQARASWRQRAAKLSARKATSWL
jgi:CHAD domain-containing protein